MADVIVGRKAECEQLSNMLNSREAEFLAMYGRRRIGKTYLITRYFGNKENLFFHCTGIQKGKLVQQIAEFTKEIARVFYNDLEILPAKDWLGTFEKLTDAIKNEKHQKKVILFFDELPWLAGPRSGFLEALDFYWNRHWSRMPQIKLIICGSSASWMIKKIINNKGGLHNRITQRIILKPFSLSETKEYLTYRHVNLNEQQIVMLYMAIGGVPYYLKQVKASLSAAQNINDLCFNPNGILFDEFNKLFRSLFTKEKQYVELVRLIAVYRQGVTRLDITSKVKLSQKGGGLSDRLEDLEAAGFISSYIPVGREEKGVYYRISDEYIYFYLTWIEKAKKSLLKMEEQSNYWIKLNKSSSYFAWAGYAFEALCYKHISEIKRLLRIEVSSLASSWKYKAENTNEIGAQIDLLFDRDDDIVTLCEIKFTDQPFVVDKTYHDNLLNKIKVFQSKTKSRKHIFISLISANGVKDNQYSTIFNKVVTLRDLFIVP